MLDESTDRYPLRSTVTVTLRGDTHQHEVGTVHSTYADGGDMVHIVRFPDGSTGHYNVDELRGRRVREAIEGDD